MNTLEKAIIHFTKQGYTVLTFKQYVTLLNKVGYDVTTRYLKDYQCVNCEGGHIYYTTSCTFKDTNIGYASLDGKQLRTWEKSEALKEIRNNFMFVYNNNLYCI